MQLLFLFGMWFHFIVLINSNTKKSEIQLYITSRSHKDIDSSQCDCIYSYIFELICWNSNRFGYSFQSHGEIVRLHGVTKSNWIICTRAQAQISSCVSWKVCVRTSNNLGQQSILYSLFSIYRFKSLSSRDYLECTKALCLFLFVL